MKLLAYTAVLLKLLPTAFAGSSCPVTQYSGRFQATDYERDTAIIGHSYRNLTINSAQECFSHCVSDCKCLSYQISGKRCELVDEDIETSSVQPKMIGYKYYRLRQHFKYNDASCSGGCRNGCCHSSPCINGGTCVEACEDVKRKFKCLCPIGVKGRYCQFIVSCVGIPGNPSSGVHTITRSSLTSQLQVYCDFTSEPNYVWTLVESFEYSKKANYYKWMFFNDHPVKESKPNWVDYRLSHADMTHIKSIATHWRATCNFESAKLSDTDYVRVDMKTQDIFKSHGHRCYQIDFLKILGTTCNVNCTTGFSHHEYHPYFLPCVDDSKNCTFNGCTDTNYSEWFGAYDNIDPKHNCSSSANSTTNWWIGYKLNKQPV